jgi:excisionase family DNA binding protein
MLADSPSSHNRQNNIFDIMEEMILSKLEAIERNSLLAAKNVLTIDDAAVLTGMSKSHLYKLTCSKQIPFYRPNGKLVYFDRQELEGWLKQNRVTTQTEAEQQAFAYVMHKK